jgi:hypothetical protein
VSSVQTMRMILTAGAALAAVVGFFSGQYLVAAIMGFGVVLHLAMSVHLRRSGALGSEAPLPRPELR